MRRGDCETQAKLKVAKEKAVFDLRLSNLRGDDRLEEKEALAATKAARDPWKRAKRFAGGRNICVLSRPATSARVYVLSEFVFCSPGSFITLLASALA